MMMMMVIKMLVVPTRAMTVAFLLFVFDKRKRN